VKKKKNSDGGKGLGKREGSGNSTRAQENISVRLGKLGTRGVTNCWVS